MVRVFSKWNVGHSPGKSPMYILFVRLYLADHTDFKAACVLGRGLAALRKLSRKDAKRFATPKKPNVGFAVGLFVE